MGVQVKMTDLIKKALRENGIAHYLIQVTQKQSAELFYIKKEIDMVRGTDTEDCAVTVYCDFEAEGKPMRGSATAVIYPDMNEAEIGTALREAAFAASFVKNPYYALPSKELAGEACTASAPSYDLKTEAFRMAEALFRAEQGSTGGFLNSAEIFSEKYSVKIINSEGIAVGYERYAFHGEFVAQCISGGQDVELHAQFAYRLPEYEQLTEKARAVLRNAADRAAAIAPPQAGKYALLISGAHVRDVLDYYVSRTRGSMIYAGYSSFRENTFLQGTEAELRGEPLELGLKATVPYSAEGIRMCDRLLAEHGVLKTVPCGARYAYYLNRKPIGDYNAIECRNGTLTLEELKAGLHSEDEKVLYVAAFSDFQTDPFSGYFGGEIRLAYLYEKAADGSLKTTLLTGGSVSGNIQEAQKTMFFSKERYKDNTYEGPYAVRFDGISAAGAE